MYIRYFWQGHHHTYGHIRCVYTALANPKYNVLSTMRVLAAFSDMCMQCMQLMCRVGQHLEINMLLRFRGGQHFREIC